MMLKNFLKLMPIKSIWKNWLRRKLRMLNLWKIKLLQWKKQIKDEDAESILRPDTKPNEILEKYERWEKILGDVSEQMDAQKEIKNHEKQENIKDGK